MIDVSALVLDIQRRLLAMADAETKSKIERSVPGAKAIGVKVPDIRALATELHKQNKSVSLGEACDLEDVLCDTGGREEILVGTFYLARHGKKVADVPWERIRRWSEALDNWETCDQLASNVSGAVVGANIGLVEDVIALTASKNSWQRRFALATASELNHKGRNHPKETFRICKPLLEDPDRSVQMAVGWAIREAGKKNEQAAFDFLMGVRERALPKIVRDAARNLPEARRAELLA